ncbi:MAG: hypothetical protein JWN99_1000 [Ilumatobacteraceae bacterium]|nr:hypothetical protein [Ilumatobacteraceae bacterium]
MRNIYNRAKTEVGYNATRFIQMVAEYGGVETAHRLMIDSAPSDGFTTLVLAIRSDLTVEHHVALDEFTQLFSDDERCRAQQRLDGGSGRRPA